MSNRQRKFTREINQIRALEVFYMYQSERMTVKQLADRLGRDECWVSDRIRIARRLRKRMAMEAAE